MNIKKLNQAKEIQTQIDEQEDLLANVKKLLPIKEDEVEVKIRGTKFKLPKKIFTTQLNQKIKDMEKDIEKKKRQLKDL